MRLIAHHVMCTAKNEPRAWELDNGMKGVSYKVEISDGSGNINMACSDEDIWNKFVPFEFHDVEIALEQTNYEGRKGVKAMITFAQVDANE